MRDGKALNPAETFFLELNLFALDLLQLIFIGMSLRAFNVFTLFGASSDRHR